MSRLSNFVEPVGSVVGSMIGSGIVQVKNSRISSQYYVNIGTADTKVGPNGEFDVTITPKFDNSIMRIDVRFFGECSEWNTVYNIHKNGVRLNNSNTGQVGLFMTTQTYGGAVNYSSTPEVMCFYTQDEGEVKAGIPITYSLVISSFTNTALWVNRCATAGSSDYEEGVSEITVTEIKLNTNTDDLVTEFPYPKIGVETLTHKRHPSNGKPVYTQVFYTNIGTTYDGTITTNIANSENVYVTEFVAYRPDGIVFTQASTYYTGDTAEIRTYINNNNIIYNVSDNSNWNNSDLFVTVEYTKTTDTSEYPVAGFIPPVLQVAAIPYAESSVETLTHKRNPSNGKPVYTKVVHKNLGTTYDGTIDPDITDLEILSIENFQLYNHASGSVITSSFTYFANTEAEFRMYAKGGLIYYYTMSSIGTNADLYVFVEYTKTTDTAASPIAGVQVKQSGEILQVGVSSAAISTPYNFTNDLSVLTLNFTPKSDNSTLIFEFSCNTFRNSNTDEVTFTLFDGTNSTAIGKIAGIGPSANSVNLKTVLNNASLSTNTYYIKSNSVVGIVQNSIGTTVLQVTEIQN